MKVAHPGRHFRTACAYCPKTIAACPCLTQTLTRTAICDACATARGATTVRVN